MKKSNKGEQSTWQKVGQNALTTLTKPEIERLAEKAQTRSTSEKTRLLTDILARQKPQHDAALKREEEFRKLKLNHRKENRIEKDDECNVVCVRGTSMKPRQGRSPKPA